MRESLTTAKNPYREPAKRILTGGCFVHNKVSGIDHDGHQFAVVVELIVVPEEVDAA